jgi:hypothetical protein
VPKFFFNLQGGAMPDREGVELPDVAAAKMVAVQTACAIISQNVSEVLERGEWQMAVSDEQGLALFSLTFFTTDAPAVRTVTIGHPPTTPGS